ncbi:carboxylesterase/lipase family protein [Amycolatopsis sp. WGS_07]|uniref:carboxylesterase/lipase family protein n=1 Tax=Amycolatopsis sp. WGS_07 TaxID=3076764 RepID=UPI003872B67B
MSRRKSVRISLALVVCSLAGWGLPVTTAAAAVGQVVDTDHGPVRGVVTEKVLSFQGIPYAAAPVGARRWASPAEPGSWTEPLDASRASAACPQPGVAGDEDCLKLNVFTPANPSGAKRPVLVWFHGGGFVVGSGALYDPTRMVERGDVVVVTVNYRLGVLGFLAHRSLKESGDFGLEDQQAALRWVKRNAAAFGGDPDLVTAFGESAGATGLCGQLVSPGAAGLFRRAILQSGPCAVPFRARAEAETDGERVAAAAGCAGADPAGCLRGRSVAELLAAAGGQVWQPVAGTSVVPVQPADALRSGDFHRVDLLVGGNRDEARFLVGPRYDGAGKPVTAEQYPEVLRQDYGADADKVLARYPLGDYATPSLALAAANTDYQDAMPRISVCPTLWTAQSAARHVTVRAYEFSDRTAPPRKEIPGFPAGAQHTAELQYLFRYAEAGAELTATQRALGDAMIGYWTSFARTGVPESPGAPVWPRFGASSDVLAFSGVPGGIALVDLAAEHQCGFWSSLGVPGS